MKDPKIEACVRAFRLAGNLYRAASNHLLEPGCYDDYDNLSDDHKKVIHQTVEHILSTRPQHPESSTATIVRALYADLMLADENEHELRPLIDKARRIQELQQTLFNAQLPELRKTHAGQYVVYLDGPVVYRANESDAFNWALLYLGQPTGGSGWIVGKIE